MKLTESVYQGDGLEGTEVDVYEVERPETPANLRQTSITEQFPSATNIATFSWTKTDGYVHSLQVTMTKPCVVLSTDTTNGYANFKVNDDDLNLS